MEQSTTAARRPDKVENFFIGLRKLTEFYFQLATVLILAGLIDATARAHPESRKLWFASQVTAWAVFLWTGLHLLPIIKRWMMPNEQSRVQLLLGWSVSVLLAVLVAATLINPFSALASGWVK